MAVVMVVTMVKERSGFGSGGGRFSWWRVCGRILSSQVMAMQW